MKTMASVTSEAWLISEVTDEVVVLSRDLEEKGLSVPRELLPAEVEEGDLYRVVAELTRRP